MTTSDPNPKPIVEDAQPEQITATEELAGLLENPTNLEGKLADAEEEIILEGEDTQASLNWSVIVPALVIVLATVVWGIGFKDSFTNFASSALSAVVDNLGWAFILFGTVFVFFIVVIAASKFGTIRLGRIDEAPEFRTVSWISMMFAASMGIGLMFYGTTRTFNLLPQWCTWT